MKASERVLQEEYLEAKAALADDDNPGPRMGLVAALLLASASASGGAVAHPVLFIPAAAFGALTWWCASRIRAHRRTIRRWRDQERERLALAEAEKIGKGA